MGIAGAGLVLVWAYGLLKSTGRVLLDAEMDAPVVDEIREVIAASPVPAEITDLHVWRVASGKYACILGLTVSGRSEEHTSELQSLMRISYAVFCLQKKKKQKSNTN